MELLKSAFRQLRAHKTATTVIVLLLALGIGANTAIFSVVDAVLLKPLPYPDPGDLVLVRKIFPENGGIRPGAGDRVPDVEFGAWVEAVPKSFRALAAYRNGNAAFEFGEGAAMVPVADVTDGFFGMLGVTAFRGRLFEPADMIPGATPVTVLSHAKWMSQFNGDDSVIGRVVKLDDVAHTVIGVLPPAFEFVDPAEFWKPLPMAGIGRPGEMQIHLISAFGRLLPGTQPAIAARELDGISERYWENPFGSLMGRTSTEVHVPGPQPQEGPMHRVVREAGPAPEGGPAPGGVERRIVHESAPPAAEGEVAGGGERREIRESSSAPAAASEPRPTEMRIMMNPLAEGKARLVPLQEHLVQQSRTTLWLLLGAVGLVLLIASANIASLQLARAEGRKSEIAVRSALGASPRRLVTSLLLENLMLALGGGLLGILFAAWGIQGLEAWLANYVPHMGPVEISPTVLGFGLLLSVVVGLLFGLAPALQAGRIDLIEALKTGGHQGTRAGHRWRQALVAAEVTLALMLAINTGLLARSIYTLSQADPGFRTEDVMTARLSLPHRYGTPTQQRDFAERWVEGLRSLPGVKFAALSDLPPLTPYNQVMMVAEAQGGPTTQDASVDSPPKRVAINTVTPDYFRAMGIALKDGRLLAESDTDGAPNVAVVNESYVKQYFPNGIVIGTPIELPFAPHDSGPEDAPASATVVGVVADVRPGGLDASAQPLAYFPLAQSPRPRLTAVVQFSGSSTAIARSMTQTVHRIDPGLAVASAATLADQIARQTAPRRITFLLTSAFAITAIILASLGIFGVMSYTVAQRTQEIGVRMALGADEGRILRWVMGFGGTAIGAGLLAGLILTLATGRALRSFMEGIEGFDPLAIAAAVAVLAVSGVAACLLPAVRATRVSPVEALREG